MAAAGLFALLRRLLRLFVREDVARKFVAAVEAQNLALLARLHGQHASLRFPVPGHANLLICAAAAGSVEIVRFVREKSGISLEECNAHGDNALLAAAFADNLPVLLYLLEDCGMDIGCSDYHGNGLAAVLCANGHHATLCVLLEKFPQLPLNARNVQGQSCVHRAARHNHPQILRELGGLEGVDLQPRDINGDSPLHLAAAHFHVEALRELLAWEGEEALHCPNGAGETPLSIVLRHLNAYVARYTDADVALDAQTAENYLLRRELPPLFAALLSAAKA